MGSSEFSGKPLVAGSIFGTKSFDIAKLGRLHGAANGTYIYRPGENIAGCNDSQEAANHPLEDCSHGFYAYSDGSNDYDYRADVTGVIEGFGTTQVGTRGFRSEKCRIVALYDPHGPSKPDPRWVKPVRYIQRLRINHDGGLTFTRIMSAFLAVIMIVVGVPVLMIPVVIVGLMQALASYALSSDKYDWREYRDSLDKNGVSKVELVSSLYPGVKIFYDYDEMVDSYDIMTKRRKLRELTPENPNFWEVQI